MKARMVHVWDPEVGAVGAKVTVAIQVTMTREEARKLRDSLPVETNRRMLRALRATLADAL